MCTEPRGRVWRLPVGPLASSGSGGHSARGAWLPSLGALECPGCPGLLGANAFCPVPAGHPLVSGQAHGRGSEPEVGAWGLGSPGVSYVWGRFLTVRAPE